MLFVFILAALSALLAMPCQADTLLVSPFDLGDDDTGTNEQDPFDFQQVLGGGAVDSDIRIQTSVIHDHTNGGEGYWKGGTESSHWAGMVVVTAGETAYYQPCDNTIINADTDLSWPCENTIFKSPWPSPNKLSVALSLDVNVAPGAQRRVIEFVEDDATPGCALEIKTDRTLEVFYNATALSTVNYPLLDGTWVGITLTQENSGSTTKCILKINGRTAYTSLATTYTTISDLANVRFGAIGTGGSLTMYFDDFVLDDKDAGYGYVANLSPTGPNVTPNMWTRVGCAIDDHGDCIDDYSASPYTFDDSNYLQIAYKYREEYYEAMIPSELAALPDGASVTGMTTSVIGWTTAVAGTREMIYTPQVGETTLPSITRFMSLTSTERRPVSQLTYPKNQASSQWMPNDVNDLRWSMKTGSTYTTGRISYVGEVLFSVGVRFAVAPPRDFLNDHNKGDEDGLETVLFAGDSMLGLTEGATCTGNTTYDGEMCSFPAYCWWDRDLYRDHPTGGCQDEDNNLDDSKCTICSGGGEHYCTGDTGAPGPPTYTCGNTCSTAPYDVPCTLDSQCTPGTCVKNTCGVGGFCDNNDAVECAVDSDCHALGVCLTAAKGGTCVWSCGPPADGGFCPAGGTFADYFTEDLAPDVLIRCAQGGESSYGLLNNRFSSLLDGIGAVCSSSIGSGRCRCTTDAQCQTTSGGVCDGVCVGGSVPWSQCDENSDCLGGGTCNSSAQVCWASDAGMDECTNSAACPSALCDFPNPDYTAVQSSINDTAYYGSHNPECAYMNMIGNVLMPCWAGSSPTSCVQDSDCETAVHKDSVCIGRRALSSANMCASGYDESFYHLGACTLQRQPCRSDTDCGDIDLVGVTYSLGGNCTQDDSTDLQHYGGCTCSADVDCSYFTALSAAHDGTGNRTYYCRNGICTRGCTTDAHCGDAAPRSCDTGAARCRGYCTLPSAANICITDADCVFAQSAVMELGGAIYFHGYCDTTNKVCTGGNEPGTPCTVSDDCNGGGTCSTTCRCTGPQHCIASAEGSGGSLIGVCSGGSEPGSVCIVDTDCAGGGTCISGSDGLCSRQFQDFLAYIEDPTHSALANYDAMQAQIDALGEGTPPMLVLLTIQPDNPMLEPPNECYGTHPMSETYSNWVSQNLISDPTRFPHVIDFRDAFFLLPPYGLDGDVMYRDSVHLTVEGSEIIARKRINPWFAAINTCAVKLCSETWKPCSSDSDCATGLCAGGSEPGSICTVDSECAGGGDCNPETCSLAGPVQRPQRYCQLIDEPHTWTSTACDDETPCSDLAYTCAVMPCTCACTGSPLTCTGSAGVGETCASANACCVAEFGVGYTCSGGVCSGALVCLAAGDACNPE